MILRVLFSCIWIFLSFKRNRKGEKAILFLMKKWHNFLLKDRKSCSPWHYNLLKKKAITLSLWERWAVPVWRTLGFSAALFSRSCASGATKCKANSCVVTDGGSLPPPHHQGHQAPWAHGRPKNVCASYRWQLLQSERPNISWYTCFSREAENFLFLFLFYFILATKI